MEDPRRNVVPEFSTKGLLIKFRLAKLNVFCMVGVITVLHLRRPPIKHIVFLGIAVTNLMASSVDLAYGSRNVDLISLLDCTKLFEAILLGSRYY